MARAACGLGLARGHRFDAARSIGLHLLALDGVTS